MRVSRITAVAAASALLLAAGGCYTGYSTTRTWGESGYREGNGYERRGRVETIRETVDRQVGNPAGGAVAGALVGGVLTGRAGGAILGALFGAAASSGSGERRYYEVFVVYDDGARQVFTFQGYPPFQVGDRVVVTDRGIFRD
ncbi:MAG TPA: hypothetical protein VLT47_09745 [Anaeromyxobacteraceae bacterium]|nr:hypothetical protein [Anaeromyxobacteraceae bacterium]